MISYFFSSQEIQQTIHYAWSWIFPLNMLKYISTMHEAAIFLHQIIMQRNMAAMCWFVGPLMYKVISQYSNGPSRGHWKKKWKLQSIQNLFYTTKVQPADYKHQNNSSTIANNTTTSKLIPLFSPKLDLYQLPYQKKKVHQK